MVKDYSFIIYELGNQLIEKFAVDIYNFFNKIMLALIFPTT